MVGTAKSSQARRKRMHMTHIQLGVYIFRSVRTDLTRLFSLLGAAKPRWADYAAYHSTHIHEPVRLNGFKFVPSRPCGTGPQAVVLTGRCSKCGKVA
jgi:hypothetical protein